MKKLIVSLLTVMTVSLSGFALAGAKPVEAPAAPVVDVVAEAPVAKPAPKAAPEAAPEVACKPSAQNQCASEEPVAKQEPAPVVVPAPAVQQSAS